MKKSKRHLKRKTDTKGLGPRHFRGGEVIGLVDEVNGPGSQLCPSFVPTRHELLHLAKYWIERQIDVDFFTFHTGCSGSTEWRIAQYSTRRIQRLARILGHSAIRAIYDEIGSEFSEQFGESAWEAFCHSRD